jgi:1L-myo-inositol 1-phosphate cytidylyltransferase / CDP-L-myo-inositol myo-inositolphosphotransferase
MPDECIILADAPEALVELCGISTLERLLRMLQRCGVDRATILSATAAKIAQELARPSWARKNLKVTIRERPTGPATVEQILDLWPRDTDRMLMIQGDVVFDIRLLRALLAKTSSAILVDSAVPKRLEQLSASAQETNKGKLCGAALLRREWLSARDGPIQNVLVEGLEQQTVDALDVAAQPLYHPDLRRNLRPFWFPAPVTANQRPAEEVLFSSVQKGARDFPAWIHAPIETFLLRYLCRTSITPNQLTISSAVAVCLTTILFATGHLIWGVVLALIIGILDGLDGKQARIKVETTPGGKLEHRLDDFLDVAWPTALAFHFYTSGQLPSAFYYLAVLLIAEAMDGIGKLVVYSTSARSMTAPGRLDTMVRLVGGRRNIYIWILGIALILGAPAKALVVMAWWEAITAAIDIPHAARLLFLRKKAR